MAFMLRVRLDAASLEVSANAIAALGEMTALQSEHRGVITYMFARLDPTTNPNHFEFTEVYANEGAFCIDNIYAFGAHSSHPDFMAAYVKMFPPGRDPHVTSVTYGYGPGMEGKVKSVCDIVLQKCRYPTTSAGFVLSSKDWPAGTTEKGNEDGPVALLRPLEGDGRGNSHVPRLYPTPLDVELVMVCSTNAHVASLVGSSKVEQLFRALVNEAKDVRGEAYGTLLDTLEVSFRSLGVVMDRKAIDAGYVLHPHADRNGS
ncbi:hypothetical protein EMCRGX_G031571 [Ephydatia muelleri]